MALKITLKPSEKFVVNGAVIQNGDRRSSLIVQNRAAILRERDIMQQQDANTPLKRVYFAIMTMYLDDKSTKQVYGEFVALITAFMDAIRNKDALANCVTIIEHVNEKRYYKALTLCRSLFAFEEERLNYVAASVS